MWQQVKLAETANWSGAEVFQRFLAHLKFEIRFRTLLYYRLNSCECWFDGLLGSDNYTALLWNDEEYPHYLRPRQDLDIVGVVCLRLSQYKEVLRAFSIMLDQIRSMPVVLQLCEEDDPSQDQNSTELIFRLSVELQILNVLLLSWNFLRSRTFYAYELFPKFQITKRIYDTHLTLFPYKLGNLQGHPIQTMPDNSEPHTIVERSLNGTYIISGPVWQFMTEFARHVNGSLQLYGEPVIGQTLRYAQVLDLVRNGTIDIAASLRPHVRVQRDNIHVFSYPLYVGDWCTMLPVERVLSTHEALTRLMQSPFTWLYMLLLYAVHCLMARRGHLRHRLFHLKKLLIHLALICFLQAQLSAFFIGPQQDNHITNMQQLEKSGLHIMGFRREFTEYPIDMRSRYASSFLLQDVFADVVKHRNKFNLTYGYTVTSAKWQLYREAQRHFRRPLFRYSQDICVQKLSLFSLILKSNCMYRYQLKAFIIRLQEGGFVHYWYRRSFYVMVKAGRLHFEDLSTSHRVRPIRWSEWQYVLALYGAGLLASFVVVVIELTIHYVNVCLRNL
ncbi:uncharacterized protein LOC110184991 [Drosophila serrata]|uniref:uncharacterized protein LOC110184991 n=1 Tax=Drosophila serrata TaxID=7274 RepID=UPI000A1D1B8D|nr:uncharacterized protein LOC110184991 [Drosophila serrata]